MIIKEITIRNFRSYYGVNTVKFNDGLIIFIGDNGDGKTTFFEALEWLVDTSTKNSSPHLISQKKIAELTQFENDTLSISMTFDHNGEKIVEKSFIFTKNADNEIEISNFQFKGYQNEGAERTPIEGGVLLDRCFETAIRKYCFFKGEGNLNNVFNNTDALHYLTETFSNIKQFDPYYTGTYDNQGFTDYAEDQSQKAFVKVMKSDKQNSKQEKELSSNIDLLRKELDDVRKRLKSSRENEITYSTKLSEIENSTESSDQLRAINERLTSLRNKKDDIKKRIHEDYSIRLLDDMWILCGYSSIFEEFQQKVSVFSETKRKLEKEENILKGKQELAKEIAEGFIPLSPNIPDRISMQEMIKDEFCKVCGREAKVGTDAYDFMTNKLNDLIKSQQPKEKEEKKQLFPNNFLKELEQKSSYLDNQAEINSLIGTIREDMEFNETQKAKANEIQESIDIEEENKKKLLAQCDGLTEDQLQNAFENIKNWYNHKGQAEKQIVVLEKEETELETELEKYKGQYDNLAKGSRADTPRKIHNVLDKIKNAFKNAKEKNTRDFLTQLEDTANQYLEKLNIDGFYGIIRIIKKADGIARIALQDQNDILIFDPNGALKTTMNMAILFAISDLTVLKRENDYPLIFDAPTSSFSEKSESDFFKVISKINKQCVIITKSFLTENGVLDNNKRLYSNINSIFTKQ